MNLKLPCIAVIIFTLILGCASRRIPPERLAEIEIIFIENTLSPGIHYQGTGTTVFQNSDESGVETDLVEELLHQFREDIETSGYQVTEERDEADLIIRLEAVVSSMPYSRSVRGITVHAQSRFGINHGAWVHMEICFRAVDPRSDEWIANYCHDRRFLPTDIKSIPETWEGFTEEERSVFTESLRDLWTTQTSAALSSFGLVDKGGSDAPSKF